MAIYAIGDVHGCLDQLKELLDIIAFNPEQDCLWFVGDLVGRGAQSLETLRFVRGLLNKVVVLGNHDLHLLALQYFPERRSQFPALEPVFHAKDQEELLVWLLNRPLLHHEETQPYLLVHAGISPQWSLEQAKSYAAEAEEALRHKPQDFFHHMYGNKPDVWQENLSGYDRLRFIINCLTRMRFCDQHGRLNLTCKAKLGEQPAGFLPWFKLPNRNIKGVKILFGHWAALEAQTNQPDAIALDAGCVWGRSLLALRLGDERKFFTACY